MSQIAFMRLARRSSLLILPLVVLSFSYGPSRALAASSPRPISMQGRAPLVALDATDSRVRYRAIGALVQRSIDTGLHWHTILLPRSRQLGGCLVADYQSVTGLVSSPLLPGAIFVSTGGGSHLVGRGRRTRCSASTGGLFVLRPDGRGGLQRTDSQAAGLPFGHPAHSLGLRLYLLGAPEIDATDPNVLYAHASAPPTSSASVASPAPGLYRSTTAGRSWSRVFLPGSPHEAIPLPTPDLARGGLIFDAVGSTLYRSITYGASWSVVGPRSTGPVRLMINPYNPLVAYLLTSTGVYSSVNAGSTWHIFPASARHPLDSGTISRLQFVASSTGTVTVVRVHAAPLHLVAPRSDPPHFALAVSVTPLLNDQVTLAVHADPATMVGLFVVAGAQPISTTVTTDARGFATGVVSLGSGVVPRLLQIRVALSTSFKILSPWLSPGWVPGAPAAASVPLVTIPTPYAASTLGQVWAWKSLADMKPVCLASTPSPTPTSTDAVSAASASATVVMSGTVGCDAGPPPVRQDAAAAWDNADHRLYVFGGTGSAAQSASNDLWAYSTISGSWTSVMPTSPLPAPRYGAAAAWDPVLHGLLVFGGMNGAGAGVHFTNEVWLYVPAGNIWTQLSAGGAFGAPSPRAHAAVTWDAANGRLLVFGGQTDDTIPTLMNDLWSFTPSGNGGTWSNLAPATTDSGAPPPRDRASIGWDAPSGALRLFGGRNPGGGSMSDSWAWYPATGWGFVNAAAQPSGRQGAGYAWDDTHRRFIVGPGLSMLGESTNVWEFETPANTWQQVPISNTQAIPPRWMTSLVWDSADNQALVFGGQRADTGPSNDLWALVPTGGNAPPSTPIPQRTITKSVNLPQVVSTGSNHVLLTNGLADAAAASGASYVRVSFDRGSSNAWTDDRLRAYERVVLLLESKGLRVLAVAGPGITSGWSSSDWRQNAQETGGSNGYNAAIGDYANQLALIVKHFRAAPYNVAQWEIWNEPNVSLTAQCGTTDPSCLQQAALEPSNFAALLLASYNVVKGPLSDPSTQDVQLVSGGVFTHSIGGVYNSTTAGADYIRHTFDEGVHHSIWPRGLIPFDQVGEHLYVDQAQRTTPAVIETYLAWFYDAYAGYAGNVPIDVTEIGWRTGDIGSHVTTGMQALNLDTAFAAARRTGYVADLCWFELEDNIADRNNTTWGLLDRFGNEKQAWGDFHSQ